MSENATTPSVYKRGADDGFRVGLFMIALFFAAVYSMHVPVLGFLAFAMMIAVPFIVYRLMKRDYVRYPNMQFFSALWMHGISIFFFGSILLAAAVYVFLRFMNPTFIVDNLRVAIDVYRSLEVPEANEIADSLQMMIDKHMLPTAISLAISSIWSVVFSGSMLSLLLALLVRAFNKNSNSNI